MRHKPIPFILISITLSSCIRTAELPDDDASLENVNADTAEELLPTLILSSEFLCTEPIHPVLEPAPSEVESDEISPIELPLSVELTGAPQSQLTELSLQLSFEPARPMGCFRSATSSASCQSPDSAELSLNEEGFASDTFFCTSAGVVQITAQAKMNDEENTSISSNMLEVTCLPSDSFELNCSSPTGEME